MEKLKTAETAKHEHHTVDDASTIDWHRMTFPLGVRTNLTELDPPYLALGPDELEILHKLLTKVLPGCDHAAADEYLTLLTLATWAKRAREWALRSK